MTNEQKSEAIAKILISQPELFQSLLLRLFDHRDNNEKSLDRLEEAEENDDYVVSEYINEYRGCAKGQNQVIQNIIDTALDKDTILFDFSKMINYDLMG